MTTEAWAVVAVVIGALTGTLVGVSAGALAEALAAVPPVVLAEGSPEGLIPVLTGVQVQKSARGSAGVLTEGQAEA